MHIFEKMKSFSESLIENRYSGEDEKLLLSHKTLFSAKSGDYFGGKDAKLDLFPSNLVRKPGNLVMWINWGTTHYPPTS